MRHNQRGLEQYRFTLFYRQHTLTQDFPFLIIYCKVQYMVYCSKTDNILKCRKPKYRVILLLTCNRL